MTSYSNLPNKLISAPNGVDFVYRDTGGGVPLVLFQHFRGNLDNWDPALIDALAPARRVITVDNAGIGGSSGTTPKPSSATLARATSQHGSPTTPLPSTGSRAPVCDRLTASGWLPH